MRLTRRALLKRLGVGVVALAVPMSVLAEEPDDEDEWEPLDCRFIREFDPEHPYALIYRIKTTDSTNSAPLTFSTAATHNFVVFGDPTGTVMRRYFETEEV